MFIFITLYSRLARLADDDMVVQIFAPLPFLFLYSLRHTRFFAIFFFIKKKPFDFAPQCLWALMEAVLHFYTKRGTGGNAVCGGGGRVWDKK